MTRTQDDPGKASRAGRRGASSTARDDIARSARELFGEVGYDHASLRLIAERADVDVALISYFYGSKQQLFVDVVELPFDPAVVLPHLLDGDPDGIGTRLAGFILTVLADEERRASVLGMLRSAATHDDAARLVRQKVTAELLLPIASHLGAVDAELRAGLAMSQIVGFTFARHIVALDVLAGTDVDRLQAALGPTLQRYLVGDLSA
ncbi:TetR family transcriptional regulator [soil metagenome]